MGRSSKTTSLSTFLSYYYYYYYYYYSCIILVSICCLIKNEAVVVSAVHVGGPTNYNLINPLFNYNYNNKNYNSLDDNNDEYQQANEEAEEGSEDDDNDIMIHTNQIMNLEEEIGSSNTSPRKGSTSSGNGFVINTWAFLEATNKAWEALTLDESDALTAVEVGCSECEKLQCDYTVGYGGSPDENGETTLDALIMNGNNHAIGAVGALRRIKSAISVARKVMEHTSHSILVGELATDFALAMGFVEENLTTPISATMHANWRNNSCQPNFWRNVSPDPTLYCGPYKPIANVTHKGDKEKDNAKIDDNNKNIVRRQKFDRFNHDTIGMIVIDGNGSIASGTSSNGARNKIPGRVGDAAIVGAGTYVDKDVGGAAATGDGDVMMRFLPSLVAVEQMRGGSSPQAAATFSIGRIVSFYPNFNGALIVMNLQGHFGAACHGMTQFPFSVRNSSMETATEFYVNCEVIII